MRKVPLSLLLFLFSIGLVAVLTMAFFSASAPATKIAAAQPIIAASPNFSVTTRSYNNYRTSTNLYETTLNTSNVVSTTFGRLFVRQVDGQIYAQPLYMPNVNIPGVGLRNIVYVATQRNNLYAFDADDPIATAPYWQVYLGQPATTPTVDFGSRYGPYKDIVPNIGVTGTPVIDAATNTLYVVAFTKRGGQYYHELTAVDIQSGQKKKTVTLTGSVPGTGGDGNVDNDPNTVTFDSKQHLQRPGLLLHNNKIYIAFAGYADTDPYHGWVMAYDKTSLGQVGIFNDTPSGNPATAANEGEGGIWMSGQGLAVGDDGFLYVVTGNGTVTAPSGGKDYGNAMLKLDPALAASPVVTWFIPYNYATLNSQDADLGVGGAVVLPGVTAPNGKSLVLTGSKEGKIYVLYRDALGGNCPTSQCNSGTGDTNVYQTWLASNTAGARHIHGSPVWWDGPGGPYMYIWNENDYAHGFAFNKVSGLFNPNQTVTLTSLMLPPSGMPGGILSLSANGSTAGTGVLWALTPLCGDANPTTRPGILRAFDATDLRKELWNSEQVATTPANNDPCIANDPASYQIRDRMGYLAKFNLPMVANGKVYVGTFSDQLAVYGLYTQTNIVNWPVADSSVGGTLPFAQNNLTPAKTVYFVPPKNSDLTLSLTAPLNFGAGVNLLAACSPNGPQVIFDGQGYTGAPLNLGISNLIQGIHFWHFASPLEFADKTTKFNCVKVSKT